MSRSSRSREGMVVAAHPIAADAGASILRAGGSAVEAAVATSLVLGVVEPFASGLGGGGYFMVCPKGDPLQTEIIEGRGTVSSLLGGQRTYPFGSTIPGVPKTGPLSAAIPGYGRAMELLLKRHGGIKPLQELFAPAIEVAEKGFSVSKTYVRCQNSFEGAIRASKECARKFLNAGRLLNENDTLVQKGLARTLRIVAEAGWDVLYNGEIGQKMLEYVNQTGPVWGEDDLKNYEAKLRTPLSATISDHLILTMPPPSRGGAGILRALHALQTSSANGFGVNTGEWIVALSGVIRQVFTDLYEIISDPDLAHIPHEELSPSPSTTHFTIADKEGTIVSASQTIGHFFGSGLVTSGIVLNDDLADCDPVPDRPNSVKPGHRTVSNMAPTMVFQDGLPRYALGTPGSLRIFPALTQVIANLLLHGKSLEEAVNLGRIQWENRTIFLEGNIDAKARDIARELTNERIVERGRNDLFFGGVHAIEIRNSGIIGVADPRRDGVAVGL